MLQSKGLKRVGHNWATEQLSSKNVYWPTNPKGDEAISWTHLQLLPGLVHIVLWLSSNTKPNEDTPAFLCYSSVKKE